MSRSDFYKRFLLVVTIILGIVSVGSYTVSADSSESGSAVVSFTHPTLNPNNPRLPLADTDGPSANNGKPSTATETVVVDTTPEKTKVTDTSTSTRQNLADTSSTRRTLPQTGTATMPMILVLMSIAMGLMMGWQVLTNGRKLAK